MCKKKILARFLFENESVKICKNFVKTKTIFQALLDKIIWKNYNILYHLKNAKKKGAQTDENAQYFAKESME